jgi:cytochrome P450
MPSGSRALKILKQAAGDLLEARRELPVKDDLVSLLISAGQDENGEGLSRGEQRDNLIGFFIAGHETTALTLTWALYLVGSHKPTVDRIREEVVALCSDNDITYKDISSLTFTQAVIDETMRLYPPAPMLNRECHEATTVHGRDIEVGDTFLLCNYVMHRTERLWDEPLVFDPARFLDNPSLKFKGAPYMPFGAGPRICVGAAFATMEAVMALATLIRDYDVEIKEAAYPRPLMTVTLRPEGGVLAKFKKLK